MADANVIYSRVLRDYVLYSADAELISVVWSPQILDEVIEHLRANIMGFTVEAGGRLRQAMNEAFPYAEIEPGTDAYRRLTGLKLPDDDDRHVLAAALAADATVLCTANVRDFPVGAVAPLGVHVMTPDALLCALVVKHPDAMRAVHNTVVARLPGATDQSTCAALRRAGAPTTAQAMVRVLALSAEPRVD